VHAIGSSFNNAIEYRESQVVSTEVDTLGDVLSANKSIKVSADVSEYPEGLYSSITFISIYRQSEGAVPIFSEISQVSLTEGKASTIHTGTEAVINISQEDYLDNSFPFITNKTFSSKDGLLLLGNTKTTILDVDYDATTRRFTGNGQVYDDVYKNPYNDETGKSFGDLPSGDIGLWADEHQYRYQDPDTNDGNDYLGGTGSNISYKFILHELDGGSIGRGLSNTAYVEEIIDLGDGYDQVNNYLNNFNSPYIRNLRGYKRGEVYRFAIGFYDKKGTQSFLKYIGDIKMPELSEKAGYITVPGTEIDYFPIAAIKNPLLNNQVLDTNIILETGESSVISYSPDFSGNGTVVFNYNAECLGPTGTVVNLGYTVTLNGQPINSGAIIAIPTTGTVGTVNILFNQDLAPTDVLLITFFNPISTYAAVIIAGSTISVTDTSTSKRLKMFSLGVEFDVQNLPENICSYKIFRVEREDRFKTRLSQGYGSKTFTFNSDIGEDLIAPIGHPVSIAQYYEDNTANGTQNDFSDRGLIPFHSPEVSYNTLDLSSFGKGYLKPIGAYSTLLHTNGTSNTSLSTDTFFQRDRDIGGSVYAESRGKFRETKPFTNYDSILTSLYEEIEGSYRLTPNYGLQDVGTEQAQNYLWNFDQQGPDANNSGTSTEYKAYSGTKQFVELLSGDVGTNFGQNVAAGDFNRARSLYIYDYIRLLPEHYGGNDEDSVAKNIFIPVTRNLKEPGVIQVFNGDVFTEWYDSLYAFWDQNESSLTDTGDEDRSYYINVLVPVETPLNLSIAQGRTLNTGSLDTVDGEQGTWWTQETSNDTGDYYLYDTVYSSGLLSRPGFTKPFNYEAITDSPTRIHISDVKIYGESIDAWSIYRALNYRDLDPNYGALTKLESLRDEIYGIQTTGFGILSINPRAVTTTTDGIQTELGSAGGLQDFNYISTDSGTIHQNSVVATENSLYFYDSLQNRIIAYSPGVSHKSLAEENGYQSTMLELAEQNASFLESDLPYVSGAVIATYEPTHREVFFTFHGLTCPESPIDPRTQIEGDSKTIVWAEKRQTFNDEYSHTPRYYLDDKKHLFSPNPDSPDKVYIHDKGRYGTFYDVTFPMSISLIINGGQEQKLLNKLLAYGEYNNIVRDGTNIIQDKGFDMVSLTNDYQSSGELSLDTLPNNGEHVRRFRKWRFHFPLDQSTNDYMRGPWTKIELKYLNQENYNFLFQSFLEYYTTHEY
jgi:hypothetical protein